MAAPSDGPDERIKVGILIVGGSPAGLAAAIGRVSSCRSAPEELAERLGDVPIAVVGGQGLRFARPVGSGGQPPARCGSCFPGCVLTTCRSTGRSTMRPFTT